MELGKFTITYDFWLPWMFGLDEGWGCNWFDAGPFTIYWSDDDVPFLETLAISLYTVVSHHFGPRTAYAVDTFFFMLTGVSGYLLVCKQKGKWL